VFADRQFVRRVLSECDKSEVIFEVITMEQQKVWVPCDRDGFTLGVIQDIGSDTASVLRFNDGQVSHAPFA
jgi:hypothetical protein